MGALGVDPSAGITLALSHAVDGGGSANKRELAVVGLCNGGSSLAVFSPALDAPSGVEAPLTPGVLGATGLVSSLADLEGTEGGVLELRQPDGGSVAVTLSGGAGGRTGAVSVVRAVEGAKKAWSCAGGGGCALAGGVSLSGKTFVASASLRHGGEFWSTGGGDVWRCFFFFLVSRTLLGPWSTTSQGL